MNELPPHSEFPPPPLFFWQMYVYLSSFKYGVYEFFEDAILEIVRHGMWQGNTCLYISRAASAAVS
jgi:hypothetical protein